MSLVHHLDKIGAFLVIAEAGKLNEAARRLHLSQPSLTRLIQTLENASGAKLLERGRHGVSLTPAGTLLREYAKSTLSALDDLEERIKNPGLESAGLLRIGSYESLAEYLWPDFIVAFKKIAPELKITVRTSNSYYHQTALNTGELDLMVDAEPRLLGDFTSWKLYDDHFSIYAAAGKLGSSMEPSTIGSTPLIFCPGAFDKDNRSILQLLEERGYSFKEKMELDSFPSVKAFGLRGMGLAVLPQRLAENCLRDGTLVKVSLKGIPAAGIGPHTIYATARNNRVSDPRIVLLLKELRKWFR